MQQSLQPTNAARTPPCNCRSVEPPTARFLAPIAWHYCLPSEPKLSSLRLWPLTGSDPRPKTACYHIAEVRTALCVGAKSATNVPRGLKVDETNNRRHHTRSGKNRHTPCSNRA